MNGKEEYIKKIISIILGFNFHYCYLTPPLELVIDSVEKHFIVKRQETVFSCDRWNYIHSVFGSPCFIR